jgi:ABC-2 type transport system ATP-binding protein
MRAPIVFDDVSRWFGDLVALDAVCFEAGPGLTAVVGANGAGKSTLLRLVAGVISPSAGRVRVLGHDPRHDAGVHRSTGLAVQSDLAFDRCTPLATVSAMASGRIPRRRLAAAVAEQLAELGVDPMTSAPLRSLPNGVRQRVRLAAALVADPALLVLDEPMTGLSADDRRMVGEHLRRLGDEGRTVLMTSQIVGELEALSPRLLVLESGRLGRTATFAELRDGSTRLRTCRVVSTAAVALAAALQGTDVAISCTPLGEGDLDVTVRDLDALRRHLLPAAERAGVTVLSVSLADEQPFSASGR